MPELEAQDIKPLLEPFGDERANLIPILQEIQASLSYLPQEALRRVARKLHIPLTEVYQVATFYRCFSLQPRGRHLVQVCLGTACHVRGGDLVLERAQTESGAGVAGTSPDMEFTVEPVRCLGCCGLAPVMRVDRDTFAHLEQTKVRGILNRYRPRKKPVTTEKPANARERAAHD
ncbi:MAG TPA: NAD(P)H-dependent oxidoreductase subunit E [Terriglobales bacterium]|nr:NAD(P)H-dependent oxidoreductase subunit E [Terriglobales bacterium]